MPSADDFVPNSDPFDDQPPPAPSQPTTEPEDPWGFTKSSPKIKKRKKAKKDVAVRKKGVEEADDSSAYPKSITPSPPTNHDDILHQATPPPATGELPASTIFPLVDLGADAAPLNSDTSAPAPKTLLTAPSPVVRSPRPAPAKPAPLDTPPSRPTSLHGLPQQDRSNSFTGHRPAIPVSQQAQYRRESFVSARPRLVDPPPPHLPQAHFFGLPDLGWKLNAKHEAGRPAGSDGYCCRIDSLADAGDEASAKKSRDALLVGCEGGLEVFRILANKLEVVGRLEGLRGSVIDAKILPHTERFDDLQVLRPLIAVIVHGPVFDPARDPTQESEGKDAMGGLPLQYQTTINVYSLQTQHYIATIYSSVPTTVEEPVLGQLSSVPGPFGDLELDAKGQFIVVSSGKSGEVLVFTQSASAGVENTRFRCIGKFWTSVQKSMSIQKPAAAGDGGGLVTESKEDPRRPLVSLSPRWLAIVPPNSSSNISIQGVSLVSDTNPNPPGITTHAAPPQPPLVNCEVVGPDTEGTWSRLGRQAAQGLVRYSQRGIEMGWQGWKEFTQPSPPRPPHVRSSSKDDLFPPTKASPEDPSHSAIEPAVVSIIDLESLLYWEEHKPKYLASPMATFALIDGCNFLSLSSTGTKLLTSSRKGEVSTVWDLVQAPRGVSLRGAIADSPCIKQLQRFVRNSPSTVLDCAWARDDEAIAVLTAHGTVHLHEVPQRPPPKKRKRTTATTTPGPDKADATVSLSSGMSPPSANQGFLGSLKSSWQTVSTQVNSMRSTNPGSTFGLPTTFAGFREATAAAGTAGSRAVARGLSHGYTAAKGGASDYWHADDNKIRHTKALQEALSAKSLKWVRRNNTTSVAIACGGSVYVHSVQRVTRRKGDDIISGLKHERNALKTFPLLAITSKRDAGSAQALKADSCTNQGPHGFWSLRSSTPPPAGERRTGVQPVKKLHAQVSDVETNPPYCPFHVDSRVGIYTFDEEPSRSQVGKSLRYDEFQVRGHGVVDEESWAFGEMMPPSSRINDHIDDEIQDGSEYGDDMDGGDDDNSNDNDDYGVSSQVESKLTIQPARKKYDGQQIRITTRRRQGKGNNDGLGRADGEFDLLEDDHRMTWSGGGSDD